MTPYTSVPMPQSTPFLTVRKAVGTIAYLGGFLSPPAPFVDSLRAMDVFSQEALCSPGDFVHVDSSRYGLMDFARGQLASRMLGDWLMFVDADHVFDADLCARLVMYMYRHDLDCITGLYPFKQAPAQPVLYMRLPNEDRYEVVTAFDRTRDLIPIDSAGGGCLLVRRRVFERLLLELPSEGFFDRYGTLGEDHSFFLRLKKIGVQLWCAWKVQCGHLKFQPVIWDEQQAFQAAESFATTQWNIGNDVGIGDVVGNQVAGMGCEL